MSVTQHVVNDRPALRVTRHLAHSIERVWRAVTEPAELAQWFVAEVPWTPYDGETFVAAGDQGQITVLKPPHLLAWTWGEEEYSFELAPDGAGCILVFTHVFNPTFGPDWQHAAGWETYFNRLEAFLNGGFLSEEEAHGAIDALMARYRSAFEGT